MEVRLLSVGARGFFLAASRLDFAASPLNSVAPNEKKTSGTQGKLNMDLKINQTKMATICINILLHIHCVRSSVTAKTHKDRFVLQYGPSERKIEETSTA